MKLDETTQKFVNKKNHGVFLFDIFPHSNVMAFHRLTVKKDGTSNGIVLIGNENHLLFLNDLLIEKLLKREYRSGFWSGVLYHKNKVYVAYKYHDEMSTREIIEVLSIKFRNDLMLACELMLSSLSFLQIKVSGEIIQNIPLPLKSEFKQKQAKHLPFIKEPETIIH